MTDIASLIVAVDSRKVTDGITALERIVVASQKVESASKKSMAGTGASHAKLTEVIQKTDTAVSKLASSADIGSGAQARAVQAADRLASAQRTVQQSTEALAQAHALSKNSFDSLRSSLDPAYAAKLRYDAVTQQVSAAVRMGAASQADANRVLALAKAEYVSLSAVMNSADASNVRYSGGVRGVAKGVRLAGRGAREFSMNLSQAAQSGAMSGNYLQALAVQLPDLALRFGTVGIILGAIAGVAAPAILASFDLMGNAGEKAAERTEKLTGALQAYQSAAHTARSSTADLRQEFGLYAEDVKRLSQLVAEAALADAVSALQSGAGGALEAELDAVVLKIGAMDAASQQFLKTYSSVGAASDQIVLAQETMDILTNAANESAKSLGLTVEQVESLDAAFGSLGAAKSVSEIADESKRVLEEIDRVRASSGALPAPLAASAQAVYRIYTEAARAQSAMEGTTSSAGALPGVLGSATSGAYALANALAAASSYAAGLRSAIEGLNYSNLRLTAENAALAAGQTAAMASAGAAVAESQVRMAPLLNSTNVEVREQANATLEATRNATFLNARLRDQQTVVIAAAKALGGTGGGSASGAASKAADSMSDAAKAAEALTKELNAPLVSAIDGVTNAWGDFVSRGFKDFKGFVSSILDSFKQMLSTMISTAAKNKIILSVGTTGGLFSQGQVDAAGAAGAPAGGGLGGILGKVTGAFSSFAGGISGSIGALFKTGIGGLFSNIGTALSGVAGGGLAGLAGAAGAILGPIAILAGVFSFFRKKTELLASGIRVSVTGMDALIETFQTIKTTRFWGLSKKTTTSYAAASSEVADPVQRAVAGLQEGILAAAGSLGIAETAFATFAHTLTVDTKGLSEDQALKAIQEEILKLGDAFAGMVPGLAALRKDGEGATEALNRLSASLTAANQMADTLGFAFRAVGLSGAATASKIADAFGGLDTMASATGAYYQAFYSEAEHTATAVRQSTTALAALGGAMPATRAEYRAMVEAQDLTTEAGRKLFAALVGLSGVMDSVLPKINNLTAELATLAGGAITSLDAMLARTADAQRAATTAAKAWYDISRGLRDYLAKLNGIASALITPEQAASANMVRYQTLLAAALAGDAQAARDISGAADTMLNSAIGNATSAIDAARVQGMVMADLQKLAGVSALAGGQQDVLATLLGAQTGILQGIRDHLASGGVINPTHVDALNTQLGGLQSAIDDVAALSFAGLSERIDVTLALIAESDVPLHLRALLEGQADGLTANLDFIVRSGLTPPEMFIAATGVSQHIKTIDFVVGSTLPDAEKVLALAGLSGPGNGTITLGGSFQFDPTSSFTSWYEATTEAGIGAPVTALRGPLLAVQAELTALAVAIRADTALRASVVSAIDPPTPPVDAAAVAAAQAAIPAAIAARDAAAATLAAETAMHQVTARQGDNDVLKWVPGIATAATLAAVAQADVRLAAARQQVVALGAVPAFAMGGMHQGGMRIVGEHGPELEMTGPSRITSNRDLRAMFDTEPLVREMRALRQEVTTLRDENRQLQSRVISNTGKIARIEEDWDANGLPQERV